MTNSSFVIHIPNITWIILQSLGNLNFLPLSTSTSALAPTPAPTLLTVYSVISGSGGVPTGPYFGALLVWPGNTGMSAEAGCGVRTEK